MPHAHAIIRPHLSSGVSLYMGPKRYHKLMLLKGGTVEYRLYRVDAVTVWVYVKMLRRRLQI